MPKRRKAPDEDDAEETTPRKTRRGATDNHAPTVSSPLRGSETPSRSILKQTPSKANGLKSVDATPSSLRKVLFATPTQPGEEVNGDEEETPKATRNDRNDRSARRKSQRTLQKQIAGRGDSDDDNDEQEKAIAQAILGEDDDTGNPTDIESAPDTPSKTGRPRGRPKGRRRERTPSPPPNLPPHELYFFQNRPGGNKTSANTMPTHLLLNHEDYFTQIASYEDPHADDIEILKQLHMRAFDQWVFELEEGFNICLYGYGSKRHLAMGFAQHLHHQSERPPKIVVVNGYAPGLTIRDVLSNVASVAVSKGVKLPAQPAAMLDAILATLTTTPPKSTIKLIIHSLDHSNLRKAATQGLLARLAAHSSISLIATCDNPSFPLMWDISLSSQYQFVYHDATTFSPYAAEIEVVEDVNALLGRSSRRLGGKDGVGYVLKSLPENARSLFRILVAEQLALADTEGEAALVNGMGEDSDPDDIIGVEDEDEAAAEQQQTPSKRKRGRGRPPKATTAKKPPKPAQAAAPAGVEYRTLYHKAVEEFVCSSEVNFRTLLKEFHDHQMIESKKDALGTERLLVPFRREELESILEELV
ncbi:Origin recognition complex subunit 2 [Cercospora zeina]